MKKPSPIAALALMLVVWGCTGKTHPDASSAPAPDASTERDASPKSDASSERDAPPVTCALDANGACGEGCCTAFSGRRVDFAKRCLESVLTPLGCPGPGDGCWGDDELGCYVRSESDGGTPEAYITSQLQVVDGWVYCPDALSVATDFPECEE